MIRLCSVLAAAITLFAALPALTQGLWEPPAALKPHANKVYITRAYNRPALTEADLLDRKKEESEVVKAVQKATQRWCKGKEFWCWTIVDKRELADVVVEYQVEFRSAPVESGLTTTEAVTHKQTMDNSQLKLLDGTPLEEINGRFTEWSPCPRSWDGGIEKGCGHNGIETKLVMLGKALADYNRRTATP